MTDETLSPKTRQVAYNPLRRRLEVVHPEDELEGQTPITQHWSDALGWVTIPEDGEEDNLADRMYAFDQCTELPAHTIRPPRLTTRGELLEVGIALVSHEHWAYTPAQTAARLIGDHRPPNCDEAELAQMLREAAPDAPGVLAEQLEAEGWRFCTIPGRSTGGFWMHESGNNVNCNGGGFASYGQATRAAFHSATRQVLLEAAQ